VAPAVEPGPGGRAPPVTPARDDGWPHRAPGPPGSSRLGRNARFPHLRFRYRVAPDALGPRAATA